MRANRGRPKKEVRRDVGLRIRFTQDEYDELSEMAKSYGLSMSELVRTMVRNNNERYTFAQKTHFLKNEK